MNTAQTITLPRRAPNLFWPVVFIGAGVILLLSNLGMVTHDPFWLLIPFWPVLLIVAGVEIIFSRTGALGSLVSAALGLAVVIGALLYLTMPGERVAPTWFNWNWNWNWLPRSTELRTENIAKPMDGARATVAELHLPAGRGSIKPVNDAANLVEGEFTYLGELATSVKQNNDTAYILVDSRYQSRGIDFVSGTQRWDARLNPSIPLELTLDVGNGAYEFDLRAFEIKGITLDQGSGGSTFLLPEKGQYRFKIDMGSGSLNIVLPEGMPVRVNYDVGSGLLNVKESYHVNGLNQKGIYETNEFSQSGAYVIFDVDLGSGSLTIR